MGGREGWPGRGTDGPGAWGPFSGPFLMTGEMIFSSKIMRACMCACFKINKSLSTKRETERERLIRDPARTREKRTTR